MTLIDLANFLGVIMLFSVVIGICFTKLGTKRTARLILFTFFWTTWILVGIYLILL